MIKGSVAVTLSLALSHQGREYLRTLSRLRGRALLMMLFGTLPLILWEMVLLAMPLSAPPLPLRERAGERGCRV